MSLVHVDPVTHLMKAVGDPVVALLQFPVLPCFGFVFCFVYL